MAEFRNDGDRGVGAQVPDETVAKVGRAVGQIVMIREAYREGLTELDSDEEKQELAQRAETAAVQAISAEGLSVAEYNEVVSSADSDPELERRVLAAAKME